MCRLSSVIKLLEATGAEELIVIDVHNPDSLEKIEEQKDMKIKNLSAVPLIAEHLKGVGYEGAYSLSPDVGAVEMAKAAAEVLGGGHGFFKKVRDRSTGDIKMETVDLEMTGKKAVVFDDIISSGGTMAKAVAGLTAQEPERYARVRQQESFCCLNGIPQSAESAARLSALAPFII